VITLLWIAVSAASCLVLNFVAVLGVRIRYKVAGPGIFFERQQRLTEKWVRSSPREFAERQTTMLKREALER
jgi:hypothetical protein